MKELNEELRILIEKFRNKEYNLQFILIEFEKLVNKYIVKLNNELNHNEIDDLRVSFLSLVNKINNLNTFKEDFDRCLALNYKLKAELNLLDN